MKPITDRQRIFCEAYVNGTLPGPAYVAAGYRATGRAAESCASRLLTNANIATYVKELRGEAVRESKMTRVSKLEMLDRIARDQEKGDPRVSIAAIAEENKMTGGYEPEKHELKIKVTIGGTGD